MRTEQEIKKEVKKLERYSEKLLKEEYFDDWKETMTQIYILEWVLGLNKEY